jgi:uncharacterized protein YndB with AHSA1/START domain
VSGYFVEREYAVTIDQLWRTMVEPELISQWTVTGRGGKPVGLLPVVGTRFQLVGKPTIGWNGIVECEVLEFRAPECFRFSWGSSIVEVTLTKTATGTRLRWQHEGLGWFMAALLGRVRRKMLDVGLPPVLARLAS